MLQKLDDVVFPIDDIDLDDIDSAIVTFFSAGICPVTIDLNNTNLDDDNFDDDDPETSVLVRPIAWCNRYKHVKHVKTIGRELIPIA